MLDFPNSPSVNDTFSPSGTGTTYKWDGVKWVPAGITMANPTSAVGLTPVNGSATTAMRSDAAPPINQSIAPTWTGLHTFAANVGVGQAPSTTFPLVVNNGGTNKASQVQLTNGTFSGFLSAGAGIDALNITAGGYINASGAWTASDTSAAYAQVTAAGIFNIYENTGLTVGNTINWTLRGQLTPAGGWQAQGTTTNDNAAAGYIGEYIESQIVFGTTTGLASATPTNVTSITLTPGDWDVCGSIAFTAAASTTVTSMAVGLSDISASLPIAPVSRRLQFAYPALTLFSSNANTFLAAGPARWSVSANTTIYLVTQVNFAASTLSTNGAHLFARRRR